jgi:hypothetical protein
MSQSTNPYAPPSFDATEDPRLVGSSQDIRREGDAVVIPVLGARFPDRCVVCNQPAVKRLSRKLYWHTPYLYGLILIALLIYAIVALIVRKTARFEIGLCEKHVKRRRFGIFLAWFGFFGGLVATIAVADRAPAMMLVTMLVTIASPIAGIFMSQVVSAKRIDDRYAWLKVGRPFLDSL